MILQRRIRIAALATLLAMCFVLRGCIIISPVKQDIRLRITTVGEGQPVQAAAIIVASQNRNLEGLTAEESLLELVDRTVLTAADGEVDAVIYSCFGNRLPGGFCNSVGPISDEPPFPSPQDVLIHGPAGVEILTFDPIQGFSVAGDTYELTVLEVSRAKLQEASFCY
jgi:hypothetical protein